MKTKKDIEDRILKLKKNITTDSKYLNETCVSFDEEEEVLLDIYESKKEIRVLTWVLNK